MNCLLYIPTDIRDHYVTYILHSITVETVTIGFEQTSYSASEDEPLNVQVCAEISNLLGDLECNLVVTFNAVSNNKSGEMIHVFIQKEVVTTEYIFMIHS